MLVPGRLKGFWGRLFEVQRVHISFVLITFCTQIREELDQSLILDFIAWRPGLILRFYDQTSEFFSHEQCLHETVHVACIA